jgi:hypothetical protein
MRYGRIVQTWRSAGKVLAFYAKISGVILAEFSTNFSASPSLTFKNSIQRVDYGMRSFCHGLDFKLKAAVPSISHLHYHVTCGADDLEHYILM